MEKYINIYHGSRKIIERPLFGEGKKNNDFGLGFYCTQNIDLAKEWAVNSLENGYSNSYNAAGSQPASCMGGWEPGDSHVVDNQLSIITSVPNLRNSRKRSLDMPLVDSSCQGRPRLLSEPRLLIGPQFLIGP